MDYVVFGTGYGATLMLLGWALRTFGPGLRHSSSNGDHVESGDRMLAKLSWSRYATGLGTLITTAGAVLILVTFVTMLINPGDDWGGMVAWISFGLILLAIAFWNWIYVGRYGVHGVVPERRDGSSIFRSRKEKETDVVTESSESTPAPLIVEMTPDSDIAVADRSTDDDELGEEVSPDEDEFVFDDEFEDERVSRYARYQVHHPEADGYSTHPESGEPGYVDDEPLEQGESDALSPDAEAVEEISFEGRGQSTPEPELDEDLIPDVEERDTMSLDQGVTDADADAERPVSGQDAIEGVTVAGARGKAEVDKPVSTPDEGEEMAHAEDGDREYLDVLERTMPSTDESGRASALRNLRARRSGKGVPE